MICCVLLGLVLLALAFSLAFNFGLAVLVFWQMRR